jgi:O-antigen/teichoic acid export membrane protein
MYQKKTRSLPRALAFTSVIQIVLCMLLIQKFGLWAAVWSYVLAKPVQVFFLWLESRKLFAFKYNFMKIFGLPLFYFAAVLALQYLPFNLPSETLAIIQFLLAIFLVLIIFRKDFKDVRFVVGR